KIDDLARADPGPGARRRGPRFEAGQPLADVGDEAGLPLLAVAHDVDARLGLLAHDVGHGAPNLRGERLAVVRPPAFFRRHRFDQVRRPRQAADEGGEDSIAASLHVFFPFYLLSIREIFCARARAALDA